MDFADGFANSLGAITDFRDRQRQRNLQERRIDLAEREAQQRQAQRVAQNRRAVAQDQRAEQQFESTLALQDEQTKAAKVNREKASEQLAFLKESLDTRLDTVEQENRIATANADNAEFLLEKKRAQTQGQEAAIAIDFFSDISVDTALNDPGRFAQGVGELANAAGLGDNVPTLLPLENGRFASVEKNDAGEFVKETDENGDPIVVGREEAQSMLQRLRREAESVSLAAPGGGAARNRNLDTLTENLFNQANASRGASQPQVEARRSQLDEASQRLGSPDQIQGRIDETDEELGRLRNTRDRILDRNEPLPETDVSTGRFNFSDQITDARERRSGTRDRNRPTSEISQREVVERIEGLPAEQQPFALEIIRRGREASAERRTLANRDLPASQRLDQQREQLDQIELLQESSPQRLADLQETVRALDSIQEGGVTPQQISNLLVTGSPDVSPDDIETEEQFDLLEFGNDLADGLAAESEFEDRVNSAVTTNARTEVVNQLVEANAQSNGALADLAQSNRGKAALSQMMLDAVEIGDKDGTGDPNLFMAMELQDFDADAGRVGAISGLLSSEEVLGTDTTTPAFRRDLARRIAREVDASGPNVTNKEIAGEVLSQLQADRRLNQPGASSSF